MSNSGAMSSLQRQAIIIIPPCKQERITKWMPRHVTQEAAITYTVKDDSFDAP